VTPRIEGDPRALHAGVQDTYAYIRDNVLTHGVVDRELKELAFRYVAQDEAVMDIDRFEGRERLALEWAHAIVWDADKADDDLWARLHESFTEPELVELGCAIGFELGQQHFLQTLGH
jgi:alkylhydroperoxidase family enzyme